MGALILVFGSFATVRNNDFPTSTGGKGADTAILSAWLEYAMKDMELYLI